MQVAHPRGFHDNNRVIGLMNLKDIIIVGMVGHLKKSCLIQDTASLYRKILHENVTHLLNKILLLLTYHIAQNFDGGKF